MGKAATKPAVKKKPVANSKPKTTAAKKPPAKRTPAANAATRTRGANKLGTSLRRFLQTNKLYDKFDDILLEHIDQIVEWMDEARGLVKSSGISFDVSKDKDKPYYHRNQNVTLWMDLKKQLSDILKDNGLTVAQRKEILGQLNKSEDEFDKAFRN